MRILGLDYGRKRIGVALSDPLKMTAQPHGYFFNDSKLLSQLADLIAEQEVEQMVVGYPRRLDGSVGDMAQEVEKFGGMLEQRFQLPLHYWDERMTTAESEQLLIQGNVRREKRKELRDKIAAALILQGFLDSRGRA